MNFNIVSRGNINALCSGESKALALVTKNVYCLFHIVMNPGHSSVW